jgi:hypothetical protein
MSDGCVSDFCLLSTTAEHFGNLSGRLTSKAWWNLGSSAQMPSCGLRTPYGTLQTSLLPRALDLSISARHHVDVGLEGPIGGRDLSPLSPRAK